MEAGLNIGKKEHICGELYLSIQMEEGDIYYSKAGSQNKAIITFEGDANAHKLEF